MVQRVFLLSILSHAWMKVCSQRGCDMDSQFSKSMGGCSCDQHIIGGHLSPLDDTLTIKKPFQGCAQPWFTRHGRGQLVMEGGLYWGMPVPRVKTHFNPVEDHYQCFSEGLYPSGNATMTTKKSVGERNSNTVTPPSPPAVEAFPHHSI